MKKTRKGIACMLAVSLLATSLGMEVADTRHAEAQAGSYNVNGLTWKYGIGESIGFNENTYKTVEKSTTNNNWRDGSVTANGEIGFIESCDPDED